MKKKCIFDNTLVNMKIDTLLIALKEIYKNDDNALVLDQIYSNLSKYVTDYQDLTDRDIYQFFNDFTHNSGIYIVPYSCNEEELEYTLKKSTYPVLTISEDKSKIFITNYDEKKKFEIKTIENGQVTERNEPHFELLNNKKGNTTVYIISKTKSLFGTDISEISSHSSGEEKKTSPIRLFFNLLKPDNKDIMFLYAYAIFGGLISLSLPLGVQTIVGLVMGAQFSSSLFLMIFLVIFGVLVAGAIQIMQMTLVETLQQRIFVRSAFEFAFKVPRIKLDALADKYAPELMNRFFDIINIQKSLPKLLIDFTQANLQIFFGLVLLSIYHPLFLVFGGFLLIVFYLIFRITGPNGLKASVKESKYKYEVAYWLEELARTMRIFKLAGNTYLPIERTDTIVSNYIDARKKHFKVLYVQYIYMVFFKMLVTGSLLIMGSFLIMNNQINIGQFVASEIIIILVLNAIEKVILSLENIYDVLTSVDKLSSVTTLPTEREDGIPFNYVDTHKGIEIELKGINYKAPSGEYILQDINLHILPGEKVCITGANGSGRSSLINLFTGLYNNYEGFMTINNIPIGNLNIRSYHDFVAQNFSREMVFRGTIFENVTVGRKDIPTQDVVWACQMVGLDNLIKKLPKGLDTLINPEDKSYSDGDLRKIVLARCISERPRLMLLEEFLDYFDFKHRKIIIDYFMSLKDNTTMIAISNDPEFASKCDKVIIMDHGKIIFTGKFEEISKEKYLRSMFYSLFGG